MRPLFCSLILTSMMLCGCSQSKSDKNSKPLAKVGDETIYLDEALRGMPQGLSPKDSLTYVRQYIRSRVKDLLIYEKAVKNIPQNQELEDLVESYRRSLVIYEYQQQVMNEKMQTEISEAELLDFYKSNSRRFASEHNLVKGLFIKISKNAPELSKLRQLYKTPSSESFEKIEKICVQNAGQVSFFNDKWVSFEDVMDNIPYAISNKPEFLRTRKSLDVIEEDFCYLLYIDEYVLAGSAAPFDYVRDNVMTVLMNSRKTLFIHQFEQNLLKEAERKKKIIYYK